MTENDFEIKINVPMIKELVSDKIYRSDASAFREQYVNALSHGCISYHEQNGYTDDVNVHVEFDYGLRKVTITDNGMGMDKTIFSDNFMSFGFSTVDKKTNNTRSGMFGLGAISFFRIATACIVESWDRKTDERFTFMTRNTDESEFIANRTLEGPGTKTEIFLKEHVSIRSLIDMVNRIAVNYPVVTILEINNSEGEQTISTYNNTDQDSYTKYDATMRFKDHVAKQTSDKFVEIVNNEEMELYISTQGRAANHNYLCRVPIDVDYNTGFSTYLNIKKEKIAGEDSKGNAKLQEVPKPDRDEVNEVASRYFQAKIEKLCDDFIKDIDIKTFEEYVTSDKRWVLDGYSVDDKLNPLTHEFIQKMREPVKFRSVDGIQKRNESLLTIFAQTNNVFYHSSLHKGTFDAICLHYKKIGYATYYADGVVEEKVKFEQFVGPWDAPRFINDTHGMPVRDAKQFKKDNKIQSIKTVTVGGKGSVTGILVRDGEWNNTKLTTNDPDVLNNLYPGGLYYLDDLMDYHDIRGTPCDSSSCGKYYSGLLTRNKIGLVAAKKGAKLFPSFSTFLAKIKAASVAGRLILKRDNSERNSNTGKDYPTEALNHVEDVQDDRGSVTYSYINFSDCTDRDIIRFFDKWYSIKLLPDTLIKLSMIDDVPGMTLFMPKELIHGSLLMTPNRQDKSEFMFLGMLQHTPKWTEMEKDTLSFITSKFNWMFRKYNHTHWECRKAMTDYLVKLYEAEDVPTENDYNDGMAAILDEYDEPHYYYNYEYQKMFPQLFLRSKAKSLGYTDDQLVEREESDGTKRMFVYKDEVDESMHGHNTHQQPIEINGQFYSMASVNQQAGWKAMVDDNGEAVLVNYNLGHPNIVKVDGKLKYEQEISEWD